VTPLEERIGYKFRNSLLLAEALTHPSLGHEAQRYHFDYQRLSFWATLFSSLLSEYLSAIFEPGEGQLTNRSRLVSGGVAPMPPGLTWDVTFDGGGKKPVVAGEQTRLRRSSVPFTSTAVSRQRRSLF
jgi:ribonuclease-3